MTTPDERSWEAAEERRLAYASPNGVPDWDLSEAEARLWLLSSAERAMGQSVSFDSDSQRWRRAGVQPVAGRLVAKRANPLVIEQSARSCADPTSMRRGDGSPLFSVKEGRYGVTWALHRPDLDGESPWYGSLADAS